MLEKLTKLTPIMRNSPSEDSDTTSMDKAEQRTNWAEDRTILANERTFNSWMGLGLGAVGVAIGLKAVFGAFEPTWAAKAVASLFLLIAISIYWMARHMACKTIARLSRHEAEPMPTKNFTAIVIAMSVATVATGAVLWSL